MQLLPAESLEIKCHDQATRARKM